MNLLNTVQIVIISLTCTILVHIVICRITSLEKFMLKGLLLGIFSTISLGTYLSKLERFDVIGLYLFFTAWLLYLMAFINLLNSATLKMLERLYLEPKDFLYSDDFKLVFNEEDGLKTRLSAMESNGFISQTNHSIHLTAKAQFLLKIVFFLRKIFSIDQVG